MRFLSLTLGCALLGLTAPAAAVTIGQIDDFEDGTTQGWTVNLVGMGTHPAPPVNLATGGPAGADDNYLLLTALGGGGSGSKLAAANGAQWSGDYLAAGVRAIALSVNNLGPADLSLRLAFEDPMGGPPANLAFSTDAALVAADGGWQTILFPVRTTDLTALVGSADAALSGTTFIRLYHSPAPNAPNPVFPIESVNAQLGVDDIRALAAIPEPGTWAMLLLGFGAAGAAIRARARKVSFA